MVISILIENLSSTNLWFVYYHLCINIFMCYIKSCQCSLKLYREWWVRVQVQYRYSIDNCWSPTLGLLYLRAYFCKCLQFSIMKCFCKKKSQTITLLCKSLHKLLLLPLSQSHNGPMANPALPDLVTLAPPGISLSTTLSLIFIPLWPPPYCLPMTKVYSHFRAFALPVPFASNVHLSDSAWLASVRSLRKCHPFREDFPDQSQNKITP